LSSSSVCGIVSGFSAASSPEKLHHLGRAFGLLSSIQPAEECQIAQIDERLIVLPKDLDLSEHIGKRVGLMRYEDRILVRRLT
jgi:hypothetical protein